MLETISALLAITILVGLFIFQILLILGYPLGEYAWGGQRKVLNRGLKISSATSLLIYMFMTTVLLDSANILAIYPEGLVADYGIWTLTIYAGLGIFVNLISRSKKERNLMTPVTIALFLLCLMVASNSA